MHGGPSWWAIIPRHNMHVPLMPVTTPFQMILLHPLLSEELCHPWGSVGMRTPAPQTPIPRGSVMPTETGSPCSISAATHALVPDLCWLVRAWLFHHACGVLQWLHGCML